MEGERERLNQRITALTGKLADTKFSSDVKTFNVRAVLASSNQDIVTDVLCFVFLLAAVTRTDQQIHIK